VLRQASVISYSVDLNRSRFAVPLGFPEITPVVELLMSQVRIVDDDASPNDDLYSAATPATCGDAIDVPLMVFVAELLVAHADVIPEPGAYRCAQLPKFENDDFASLLVDDITLVTFDALAGEKLQAFALEFPAATATKTPAFERLFAAEFRLDENPPPSDMFATAGLM
jgi:hypothetical protein